MANVIERIKAVAGQIFDDRECRVTNPRVTARESIELADYIVSLERRCNDWRRLALQFDGHRMQAISLLKNLETYLDVTFNKELALEIRQFLSAAPVSGDVLKNLIGADALDAEADLLLAVPELAKAGAMMKTRAALMRAKVGTE